MKMVTRTLGRAAAAVAVGGALAGCSTPWTRFRDDRVVTLTHHDTGALRVESANGSVRISPGDPALVRVDATLWGPDLDRLGESAVVTEERDGGLYVGVEWAGGVRLNNEGCDFIIAIPAATVVTVRTSNDEIIVDHVGDEVDLTTSDDEVEVLGVPGRVRVVTSNDHVTVRGTLGPVEVTTSNDEVYVELAPGAEGPVELRTSNDDIVLHVGPAFGGRLSAGTSNGRVRVVGDGVIVHDTDRRTHAELEFDHPGGRSTLSTSNSNITIVVGG